MSSFFQQAEGEMQSMMGGGNSNNSNNQNPNSSGANPSGASQYIQEGETLFNKEYGNNSTAMMAEKGLNSYMGIGQGQGQGQSMGNQGMDPSMGGPTGPTQGAISGTTSAQSNVEPPTVPGSATNVGVDATGGKTGTQSQQY